MRSIKNFYPLQDGKGSTIQLISPAEGSVQRAKLDLKRQLQDSQDHSVDGKRRRKTPKQTSKKKRSTKPKRKTIIKRKKSIKKKK